MDELEPLPETLRKPDDAYTFHGVPCPMWRDIDGRGMESEVDLEC